MATLAELARRFEKREGRAPDVLESRILETAAERRAVSRNQNERVDRAATWGDRVADSVARFGGSWTFILAFLAFLAVWTIANTLLLSRGAFDPYPFIFLNLLLSMIAALQAPVIMMSQNRQGARDRIEAEHDYAVNLKAELEIMALHEKLDALRGRELAQLDERIATLTAVLERLQDRIEHR